MEEYRQKTINVAEFLKPTNAKVNAQIRRNEKLYNFIDGCVELFCEKVNEKTQAPSVTEVKTPPSLPDALDNDEARALLDKCVKAGWLDENFQLKGLPKTFYSILAFQIGLRLRLEHLWMPFEQLWHIKNLRQTHYGASSVKPTEDRNIKDKYEQQTAKIEEILK